MAHETQKNRKWKRYGCLLPCRIIPQTETDMLVSARIINIGRGGLLIEADYDFNIGDRVIVAAAGSGFDRFEVLDEIQGTVRWGQIDQSSLMGLYYIGVEFDELSPLKQAVAHQP
ncbi:MAG: PilZ domain-containing protein [Desulfomicrobium sp.]|nr:PilZ domain-containing protein [Desulfomicrobium sp.]